MPHGDLNHRTVAPGVPACAGTCVKPTGVLSERFRRGWVNWLRPNGVVLADLHTIDPLSVSSGDSTYPPMTGIEAALRARTDRVTFVPGLEIAGRLGDPRMANTVLLGALSNYLDVPVETWLQVIGQRLKPQYVAANHDAFQEGRNASI